MSVVVIGDANVDLEIILPRTSGPAPHANPEPRLFGGGSAANTAAALARLGVECRFVGTVGDDSYGRLAAASLATAGVDIEGVATSAEAPTVLVIIAIAPDGERLIYVWPPSGGAHGDLDAGRAVGACANAEWLHVSGICLRVSPAREAVLAAMERARSDGVPVSFDLNLRLENWGWDHDFRAVVDAAVARADVIMGAATDEIVPLGGSVNHTEAALSLAGNDRLVIARLGAAGAIACSADGVIRVDGLTVDVVDTVGAGDAFNAGFIAARWRGLDVAGALEWGNAVAGIAVSRPGARATPTYVEAAARLAR